MSIINYRVALLCCAEKTHSDWLKSHGTWKQLVRVLYLSNATLKFVLVHLGRLCRVPNPLKDVDFDLSGCLVFILYNYLGTSPV